MSLSNFALTDAGAALLARAQLGETLTITQAQVGEGTWPDGTTRQNITQLVKPVKYMAIADKVVSNGQAKITVQFSNSGVGREFLWSEFALWAADPDYPDDRSHDILYGAAYADGTPVPIDSALTEFLFNVLIKTGTAENVTVVVDGSLIYLSRTDAQTMISEALEDYTTKEELEQAVADAGGAAVHEATIQTSAWTLDESIEDGGGQSVPAYPYYADVTIADALATHFPVVAIHDDSQDAASEAGVSRTAQALDGKVRLRARQPAKAAVNITVALLSGSEDAPGDGYGTTNAGSNEKANEPGGVVILDEDGKIPENLLPETGGGFVQFTGAFPASTKPNTLYAEVVADYSNYDELGGAT